MADFDYSQLLEELVNLVVKRLSFAKDFVRSGAVCKSWASVVAAQTPLFPPALMLLTDDTEATFSCLSSKRRITIELPHIRDRKCWGTPYGWLITFGLDLHFHLLNPFTGIRLSLPHYSTFPNQFQFESELDPEHVRHVFAQKLFLSSNPSLDQNQSCIVIAIYVPHRKIAFAKPGDEAWTCVKTPGGSFKDAVYFNGYIYAIDSRGVLTICDVNVSDPIGTQIETTPLLYERTSNFDELYLLDLSGVLHLVVRFKKSLEDELEPWERHCITENFSVYKFDFQAKCWIAVTNLEDYALFVGNNTSFAISSKDYPDFKCNTIYFTDDQAQAFWNSYCDMLAYDFEKKTLEPFYTGTDVVYDSFRPCFIIPCLQ